MHISIDDEALSTIKISAKKSFPNECCGFLFGNERNISFAMDAKNVATNKESIAFQISATDYLAAEKLAVDKKTSLLGVYHSHPNQPAIPSVEDREAALPNFLYLILSITKNTINELKGWQLNPQDTFEEQPIKLN